jgi:5-formyltetrahydrofolate cyclo-ligase
MASGTLASQKKIVTTLSETQQAKATVRAQVRAELKKISASEKLALSEQACKRLEQQTLWRDAQSILFYAPLAEELDVWPLMVDALAGGKTVLLPRYETEHGHYVACHIRDIAQDLLPGKFGVREPVVSCEKILLNRLDLMLVPGLAFDVNGHRLGRGKGFYDRLLAVLHGPACGVAFDQQIVDALPVEPHDLRLNCILTPTRWHCDLARTRF